LFVLLFSIDSRLLIIAPLLIEIIPRYEKWEPALIPLALISVNTFFAASTSQLTNLLNAIGKIKITFRLMLMWTILTWIFVPYMAIHYGVNGAASGYAIVGVSSLVAIYYVGKIVKFSVWDSIGKPLLSTLIMAIVLFVMRNFLSVNVLSVGILIVFGFVIYTSIIYLLVGSSILDDAKRSLKAIFIK
jgi:O-antigen/teichoic acid export membrane protein